MPVLSLLFAGLLAPVAYSFGPETRLNYDVNVQLDGFLPLMGGNEGKVEITMAVGVTGDAPTDGTLKAASEIKTFELAFNGAKLPLGRENVVEYFPKTTITLSPTGKILSNDAPDKKLPIRLPGLDVRHFPDITYVPVELPPDELEAGKSWTFTRDFGGAPIIYTCTAESSAGSVWKIKVKLTQTYKILESPTYEVVAKPEDAVSEVTTTMTGEGQVSFDAAAGRIESADMLNKAVSDVKDIKSGETKQRKLDTRYTIKLKTGNDKVLAGEALPAPGWWQTSWDKVATLGKSVLGWVQTASLFGLQSLPRELERFRPFVKRWAPWLGV